MSDYYKGGFLGKRLLMVLCIGMLFTSCVSVKKYIYFRNLPDTSSKTIVIDQVTPYVDPKIEPSDILAITIQPLLKNVSGPSSNTNNLDGGSSGNTANLANLFPVDKNGDIEYSLIGKLKVAGLSTTEARELIREKSLYYYKDPVVNVRITNFNITVLGDVPKPGTFTSPGEKVSILDAIGNCGDLLYSARRDNILLIRSEGDQKICARYDITSTDIFKSPYYYLKQNDLIYVEPNKYKIQSSDQTFARNLGYVSSLISVISLILVFKSLK